MAIEIYPVIHAHSLDQVRGQASLSLESGADGVYIIDHDHYDTGLLLDSYNAVVSEHPEAFIGLNFLHISDSFDAFSLIYKAMKEQEIARLPDGLWVDDAYNTRYPTTHLRILHPALLNVRYLGGVAFKYTSSYTDEPEAAYRETIELKPDVDVVTTSGPETGVPPSREKIRSMKMACHNQQLAIASGISAENISEFAGLFDQLLVSTSIEEEPYSGVFNPIRLKELIDLAHNL